MRRGDVVLVDFEPARGSEANRRRPAVVVSNDGANAMADRRGRGVVTVVPLTSNVARVFPFQVALPAASSGLSQDSKAQAEQVRAVDVERVLATVGRLPPSLLSELDDRLRLHLAL
jgi:mRNA interferase MazF